MSRIVFVRHVSSARVWTLLHQLCNTDQPPLRTPHGGWQVRRGVPQLHRMRAMGCAGVHRCCRWLECPGKPFIRQLLPRGPLRALLWRTQYSPGRAARAIGTHSITHARTCSCLCSLPLAPSIFCRLCHLVPPSLPPLPALSPRSVIFTSFSYRSSPVSTPTCHARNTPQGLARNSDLFRAGVANAPVFNHITTARFEGETLFDYNPRLNVALPVGPAVDLTTPSWHTNVRTFDLPWRADCDDPRPAGRLLLFFGPWWLLCGLCCLPLRHSVCHSLH